MLVVLLEVTYCTMVVLRVVGDCGARLPYLHYHSTGALKSQLFHWLRLKPWPNILGSLSPSSLHVFLLLPTTTTTSVLFYLWQIKAYNSEQKNMRNVPGHAHQALQTSYKHYVVPASLISEPPEALAPGTPERWQKK